MAGNPTQLIFSRENKLLGSHPITDGRNQKEKINIVRSFTGQSLKGPEDSASILNLSPTAKGTAVPGVLVQLPGLPADVHVTAVATPFLNTVIVRLAALPVEKSTEKSISGFEWEKLRLAGSCRC